MIEELINSFNCRYVVLDKEMERQISDGNAIDIHINLDSVFAYFYSNIFEGQVPDMSDKLYTSITPCVINIAAHYRHYFWSRFKVPSRIFFYYGNGNSIQSTLYVPEYNLLTINKKKNSNEKYTHVNEFIKSNMELVKTLIPYIHDVYLVEIDDIDPILIPHHIMQTNLNPDKVNLIISRDMNDLQLLPINQNTYLLYMAGMKTFMINKNEIIDCLLTRSKSKYRPSNILSPKLISLIYSQSGIKSRNLKGEKNNGVVKAIKKIEKSISDINIINDYNSFPNGFSKEVADNFRAVDVSYLYNTMSNAKKEEIDSLIFNIYNNESLMSLNEHSYKTNEINLIYLEEGVRR